MHGSMTQATMLNTSDTWAMDAWQPWEGNWTGMNRTSLTNVNTISNDMGTEGNRSSKGPVDHLLIQIKPAAEEYHVVTGALLILCAIVAVVGNSIVIAVIVRVRRYGPDTVTHILILNLASIHLLLSIFCTPIEAAFYLAGSRWLMGEVACRIVGYLKSVFVAAAVITLSNIAVDRYYSVVYPMERKITTVKRHLMVCYTWVHAVVICIPYIVGLSVSNDSQGRPLCDFQWSLTKSQAYLISYSTLTIFLPLIITSLAYYLVWQAFRQSQRKVHVASALRKSRTKRRLPFASKTEIRLLKTLLLMVFCFVMLWTPYLTYLFLSVFSDHKLSEYFILTSVWISRVQPVLDPLIYGYLNNHFKRCFFEMLNNLNAIRCCKLPDIVITTNDKPTNSSDHRLRSAETSSRRSKNPQAISTITNHDGQPQPRIRNELYLPMNSYVRRSKMQGPTTNTVYVQSTSNNVKQMDKLKKSLNHENVSRNVSEGGFVRGRNGVNEEADIMEEKQVMGPTVKVGLSSVPSWAFNSANSTRWKPDQHPSVVIQHTQEEILRIDYFDRFLRKRSPTVNLEIDAIGSSAQGRGTETGTEGLHRLPPGGPMRSPLAVKKLPPINAVSYRARSSFNNSREEFIGSNPSTSGLQSREEGTCSESNGGIPNQKRHRKKRRNFLLSRVKKKTVGKDVTPRHVDRHEQTLSHC